MDQNDQHEIYLRRSVECEALAKSASDVSIREKCAELALAYRALAGGLRPSGPSAVTNTDVQRGGDNIAGTAGQMVV